MSPPAFDWSLCRSFLAILRTGSLSRAARQLGIAHPTVRRHLEEMEAALGVALFLRSPSGLTPTEVGLSLRGAAEAMESASEQIERIAAAAEGEVAGVVRIAASEVMGVEVLPPMLRDLQAANPRLQFELDLDDGLADILRRDADIAVRMVRPAQPEALARRVATVRLGLYAHTDWVGSQGPPVSVGALLSGGHMVGYDRDATLIEVLRRRGLEARRTDFGVRTDNTLAQLAAVRAGLGVGVLQAPLAGRDPHVQRVLPEVEGELEVWLVTAPGLAGTARIRACLDGLASGLARYAAG